MVTIAKASFHIYIPHMSLLLVSVRLSRVLPLVSSSVTWRRKLSSAYWIICALLCCPFSRCWGGWSPPWEPGPVTARLLSAPFRGLHLLVFLAMMGPVPYYNVTFTCTPSKPKPTTLSWLHFHLQAELHALLWLLIWRSTTPHHLWLSPPQLSLSFLKSLYPFAVILQLMMPH